MNEVIFSRKLGSLPHPPLIFNNNDLTKCSHQKHLGIVLNSKLDFNINIEQKIKKRNKIIGSMRRLARSLPRKSLLTTYRDFYYQFTFTLTINLTRVLHFFAYHLIL